MRFFVRMEVFESISSKEEVAKLRQAFGKHIEDVLMASGKVEQSGVFADARALFFILNVDSTGELMSLLGGPILDNCRVETHPICSLEELKVLFEKEASS